MRQATVCKALAWLGQTDNALTVRKGFAVACLIPVRAAIEALPPVSIWQPANGMKKMAAKDVLNVISETPY